jgi:hypothetical protein
MNTSSKIILMTMPVLILVTVTATAYTDITSSAVKEDRVIETIEADNSFSITTNIIAATSGIAGPNQATGVLDITPSIPAYRVGTINAGHLVYEITLKEPTTSDITNTTSRWTVKLFLNGNQLPSSPPSFEIGNTTPEVGTEGIKLRYSLGTSTLTGTNTFEVRVTRTA